MGAAPTLIFDKYEPLRRLAVGGMGEIFLARQGGVPGFERLVILKNLLPELAAQTKFVEQFLDEARVAATLNHPNIVAVYEVGSWDGSYYIAMEYIDGVDLAALVNASLEADTTIPAPIIARIIHDAAVALDFAHRARDATGRSLNVIHRDVSPQNIMVRNDGVIKVVDFGIARAANRATRTATGMVKGKIHYMAPEQMTGGQLDGRIDQFALGVVCWELCTRRRLFTGDNAYDIFEAITKGTVKAPSTINSEVPPELDAAVMRMLAREPGDRFPSCREVAEHLEQYLASCSRETSEAVVEAFVQRIAGDKIQEKTRGLDQPDNFVMSLRQRASELDAHLRRAARWRKWRGVLMAAALAAAAAGGVFWRMRSTQPVAPAPAAPPPVAAAPPAKASPPPVVGAPDASSPDVRGDRKPKSARPAGFLTLSTVPHSLVSIAGAPRGSTPLYKVRLSAGEHHLVFTNPGTGARSRRTVRIEPGETTKLTVQLGER